MEARHRYERWYAYAWRDWLPAFWQRVIRCETRSSFDWNSGSYQGAFGFAPSSWDGYKPRGYPAEAYQATPRQQYVVALAIVSGTGGTSGWGCA